MQLVDNYLTILDRAGPLDLLFMTVIYLGPLFALVVGRQLERAVAGAYLAALVVSWSLLDLSGPRPGADAQTTWAIIYLLIIGAIALKRGAPGWTLFAAAFQLVQTLTLLLGLAAGVPIYGFAMMTIIRAWEYLFVLSLAIGAWNSRYGASSLGSAGGAPRRAAPEGSPG